VTDPAAVRGLFDAATERFGGVDVLINNAGVGTQKPVPIAETDDELFGHIFDVNTKAVFFGMREAARRLRDGGRIVSISTALIGLALPGRAIYAGSKAAVEVFTNIMAKELRGRGITVNAIAPGPIATPLFLDGKSREEIDNFAKQAPMERLGTPEDIAEAVAFLVSEAGGWIDGQTIRANGGMV
jgi:3-oxoacyl-[acyl-carrier protein] reductase